MSLPSLRVRMARSVLSISLIWGCAVALVAWMITRHEVEEFMDQALQESAEIVYGVLSSDDRYLPPAGFPIDPAPAPPHTEHLTWQVVDPDNVVMMRSHHAPKVSLQPKRLLGLANSPTGWRTFGLKFGGASATHVGWILYVAQDPAERVEAREDTALYVIGSTLLIGLAFSLWLRRSVTRDLEPIVRLSNAVHDFDPLRGGEGLPPPNVVELAPMHFAITDLARRLTKRVESERAFTAHAAHALRTPLAGLDFQLAVAVRECAPEQQVRLERARGSLAGLRRMVNALLTLFRTNTEPAIRPVHIDSVLAALAIEGMDMQVLSAGPIDADSDLLAAALANLLDNCQKHGASVVQLTVSRAGPFHCIALHDNGGSVPETERQRLQAAIDAQDYKSLGGLGLMLADLVARSHGGSLHLPMTATGFAVHLLLCVHPRR